MRFPIIFLLSFLFSFSSVAQKEKLTAFEPLVGANWTAEGKWGDGSIFKQETAFTYGLSGNIVIARSKGFIDKEQTVFGDRNHGIRKFDEETKQLRFWEFDVFNGLTEGIIVISGKNIYYQYTYGDSLITDGWEFVDKDTYSFKVGVYDDGEWEEVYLNTTFRKMK